MKNISPFTIVLILLLLGIALVATGVGLLFGTPEALIFLGASSIVLALVISRGAMVNG